MPYSIVQYTGNGSNTLFGVTFPFLSRDHVTATVNGVQTSFTWLSDSLVNISPAPAIASTVSISRNSQRGSPVVDFQDASVLTEADLDLANKQAIYVAQEAFDSSNVAQVSSDVAIAAAAAATSATSSATSATNAASSAAAANTSAINAAASAAAAAALGSFPISLIHGGTGGTDQQSGLDLLTAVGAAAAGQVVTKVGTHAQWADPTLPVSSDLNATGEFYRGDGTFTNVFNTDNGPMVAQATISGDMFKWTTTTNAADEKTWAWRMSAPQELTLWAYNDIGSPISRAMTFKRTGANVDWTKLGGRVLMGGDTNLYTPSPNDDGASALQVSGNALVTGNITRNGAAASLRDMIWSTSAIPRWVARANATAESGSNAGTDFQLLGLTDAGAALINALTIIRATGKAGFGTAAPLVELEVKAAGPIIAATSGVFSQSGHGFALRREVAARQTGNTWEFISAINGGGATSADYQVDDLVFKARKLVTDATTTEVGRWKCSGLLGLGTNSPLAGLDIANGTLRVQTVGAPTGGTGLELSYSANIGTMEVRDRTGAVYKTLTLSGSDHKVQIGGVDKLLVDANGNHIRKASTADQSYSLQAPLTGATFTIPNNISALLIRPAGTIAAYTVTMPATPIDGQIIRIGSSQTITTFTVNANTGQTLTGAPGTITATAPVSFIYNLANTAWMRVV